MDTNPRAESSLFGSLRRALSIDRLPTRSTTSWTGSIRRAFRGKTRPSLDGSLLGAGLPSQDDSQVERESEYEFFDQLYSKLAPRQISRIPIPNFSQTPSPSPLLVLRELAHESPHYPHPSLAGSPLVTSDFVPPLPEPSSPLFSRPSLSQRACPSERESAALGVASQRFNRKGKGSDFGPEDFSRRESATDEFACSDATSDLVEIVSKFHEPSDLSAFINQLSEDQNFATSGIGDLDSSPSSTESLTLAVRNIPEDLQNCLEPLRSHSSAPEDYQWASDSDSVISEEDWPDGTLSSSFDGELSTALRNLESQTSFDSRISGSHRKIDGDSSGLSSIGSESDYDSTNLERPSIGEKMFQFALAQNQPSATSSRSSRQGSLPPSSPDQGGSKAEVDSFDEEDNLSSIFNNSSVNSSPCPDRRRPLSMVSTNTVDLSPLELASTLYSPAAAMSTPATGKALFKPQTPYQKMFNPLEIFKSRKGREECDLPQHVQFISTPAASHNDKADTLMSPQLKSFLQSSVTTSDSSPFPAPHSSPLEFGYNDRRAGAADEGIFASTPANEEASEHHRPRQEVKEQDGLEFCLPSDTRIGTPLSILAEDQADTHLSTAHCSKFPKLLRPSHFEIVFEFGQTYFIGEEEVTETILCAVQKWRQLEEEASRELRMNYVLFPNTASSLEDLITFNPPQKLHDAVHFLIESQNRFPHTAQSFSTSIASFKSVNLFSKSRHSVRPLRSSPRGNFSVTPQPPSSPHTLVTRLHPRTPFSDKRKLVNIFQRNLTDSAPSRKLNDRQSAILPNIHASGVANTGGNEENTVASYSSIPWKVNGRRQTGNTSSIVSPVLFRSGSEESSEDSEENEAKKRLSPRFKRISKPASTHPRRTAGLR